MRIGRLSITLSEKKYRDLPDPKMYGDWFVLAAILGAVLLFGAAKSLMR